MKYYLNISHHWILLTEISGTSSWLLIHFKLRLVNRWTGMSQGEGISNDKTFGKIRPAALSQWGTSVFESFTNQRREGRGKRWGNVGTQFCSAVRHGNLEVETPWWLQLLSRKKSIEEVRLKLLGNPQDTDYGVLSIIFFKTRIFQKHTEFKVNSGPA